MSQPTGRRKAHGMIKEVEKPAPRKPRPDPAVVLQNLTQRELLMRGGSCSARG